jgi:hypothetical protein
MSDHQRIVPLIGGAEEMESNFEIGLCGYSEVGRAGPVCNYYAIYRIAAEDLADAHNEALLVHTSFRPCEWPYPAAFTEVRTIQSHLDVSASEPEYIGLVTECGQSLEPQSCKEIRCTGEELPIS